MESDTFDSTIYTEDDDFLIKDDTLKAFKNIAKTNSIKKLRTFINLHNDKLKTYKTKILNDFVSIPGYKISKRLDRVFLTKITPSEMRKMKDSRSDSFEYQYKEPSECYADDSVLQEYASDDTFNDNDYKTSFNESHTEQLAESQRKQFENKHSENSPHVLNPQGYNSMNTPAENHQMNTSNEYFTNNPQTTPLQTQQNIAKQNSLSPSYIISEDIEKRNPSQNVTDGPPNESIEKMASNDSVLSANPTATQVMNVPISQQKVNPQMDIITSRSQSIPNECLYELIKQHDKQNETQRKQYEQLTKALSDSIEAKNNEELRLSNRMKTCVETIEKTFSNGTFDRIVQGINEMTKSIIENQNKEREDIKESILSNQSEIDSLKNDFVNAQSSRERELKAFYEINDKVDSFEETIQRFDEMEALVSDYMADFTKINQSFNEVLKAIKQQETMIMKLCLAVYNIDESLVNKIFTAEEQQRISQMTASMNHIVPIN